jgi:hypothetical protein
MLTESLIFFDLIVVLFQFYEHFCAKKCNLCKKMLISTQWVLRHDSLDVNDKKDVGQTM